MHGLPPPTAHHRRRTRETERVFIIVGDGIEEKAEAYRTGQATVNVAMLKFTIEKLKDAMFAKMREQGASTRAYGEKEQEKRGNNGQQIVPAYQRVS